MEFYFRVTIKEAEEAEAVNETIGVAVNCVPADKPLDAKLESLLERLLLKSSHTHFVSTLVEAAYKPSVTPVMKLAKDKYQWRVVPGAQMLVHQGVAQFETWNNCRAPFKAIYDAVTEI